jgi:hypothetical protein
MTQRIPLDDLTSDQLDQLYDRIAELEHNAATDRQTDEILDKQHADIIDAGRKFKAWGDWQCARAVQAEAQRDHYAALLRDTVSLLETTHAHRGQGGHDNLGANLTCAGCAHIETIRAALDPAQRPTAATAPPTDRAAVLHEAADEAELLAENLRKHHEFERSTGALDAMTELRRMADEAQSAKEA